MTRLTAVEFFSGMGSFADACRDQLQILAAFDQNAKANRVYEHNFGLQPSNLNLDSIRLDRIPDADVWWMSPPCTPYSVRGKRADLHDPRAKSFLRLLECLPAKSPQFLFLENVRGFEQSRGRQSLLKTLSNMDYKVVEKQLCATDFGTPMRRPRHFVISVRDNGLNLDRWDAIAVAQPTGQDLRKFSVRHYLDENFDERLIMNEEEFKKYEACLNVLHPDDPSANAICFTKGYYRCRLASGSLISLSDGRVRRFSAREILRLLGFSNQYSFPNSTSEEDATSLLGNAVDVRAIRYLLANTALAGASIKTKNTDSLV